MGLTFASTVFALVYGRYRRLVARRLNGSNGVSALRVATKAVSFGYVRRVLIQAIEMLMVTVIGTIALYAALVDRRLLTVPLLAALISGALFGIVVAIAVNIVLDLRLYYKVQSLSSPQGTVTTVADIEEVIP